MTNQLDELLKTRATLAEALLIADGIESPETAELRRAIAEIDAVIAPVHEAEQRLGESTAKLTEAQIRAANAQQFDSMVDPADLSRAFDRLFNNQGDNE